MMPTLLLMLALLSPSACATFNAIQEDPVGPVALAYYQQTTQAAVYTLLLGMDTHKLNEAVPYLDGLLTDLPDPDHLNHYLVEHVPAAYRGIVLLLYGSAKLELQAFKAKHPDLDVEPVVGAVMEGVKGAIILRQTKGV